MRILGIDGGIASIGWALIEIEPDRGEIVAAGVRTFDAPETDKERTPTNQIRRQKRGMRRVIRRRRRRMTDLRRLFAEHRMLPSDARDALKRPGLDPWSLRVAALDRRLEPEELAIALGHIARHRGFRSNSKRERGANAADDAKKALKAMEGTEEKLARWRSFAEMMVRDSEFARRKRNREGDYSHTSKRSWLEAETRDIFAAQRRLGAPHATEALEAAFADLAFSQRPLQDSEHMVAQCPFEPDQKRTAKRSPAFELFRIMSRLANLKLVSQGHEPQRLSAEQIATVTTDFGSHKSITYKSLRRMLDIDPRTRFDGVPIENEGHDVAARSGAAAEGTSVLRAVLGTAWNAMAHRSALVDRIAEIITFRDDPRSIEEGLSALDLEPVIVAALMDGVRAGNFANFTGAGHISAKAARAISQYLARGLVYSEACAEAGYDHAARATVDIKDVRNPVARKALGEMLKQVRAIAHAYGEPDLIHVELARDLGKSADERDEIKRGIDKRTAEKERRRGEFAELLHRPPSDEELLRYELWKEQNGRCLYTDEPIPPTALAVSDNRVQVDHILPWSRFGDDSFANKTLCLTTANQHKRGRTPYEWLNAEGADAWALFEARVESCKTMKGRKKRGFYLRRNAAEVEERFRARNLGDTRYATRLLLDLLGRLYKKDGARRVLARPGALTAKLRRAWGLDDIKKDEQGKRHDDDRHHALDAIVIAATTESALNRLTRAFQEAERRGFSRELTHDIRAPWEGFREQARAAVERVFVSRAERRRARGEAHAATIRQVRERDGRTIVYERKSVDALKAADLDRIKDKERNGAVRDALATWLEAGKPKDARPHSPKGDVIRKVRLETDGKVAIEVRDGTADRGEMVRIDVYREKGTGKRRDRFHLVPIYPHQVADRRTWPRPPGRAVVAYKPEVEWTSVDRMDFLFSLFQNSLTEVAKPDGEIIQGYFRGVDRTTAAITIAAPESSQRLQRGIGSKTLLYVRKFAIDRLGLIHPVERETRTWHGEVCT